jgi:zinc/manganese transport system substrate-binding protein
LQEDGHLTEEKIHTRGAFLKILTRYSLIFLIGLLGSGCVVQTPASTALMVVATENFIADIAWNIAGGRATVSTLVPFGIDPHDFQPSPKDLAVVARSQMLIVNGAGLEGWLSQALSSVGGNRILVTASQGLAGRTSGYGSAPPTSTGLSATASPANSDPHFWLDPVQVKTYVDNIRDGFIQLDPSGQDAYRRNAAAYSAQLDGLDQWIRSQVALIPPGQRQLVTDHEDLGYFADQYGFQIIGAITPNVSPDAEASASHIADLIMQIRASSVKAIFLDFGANAQLADQISRETGCRVIADLYIHSLTLPGGAAPTYLEMMRHNVTVIVEALR